MCGVLTLPNKSTVLTMDWSSDGQTLITCSDDKCLHIFSLSHHDTKQFVLSDKHGATTVPNLSPVERNAAQIEQSALGEQEKAQDPQTPDSPRHLYSLRNDPGGVLQVIFVCGGSTRVLAVSEGSDFPNNGHEILLWNIVTNSLQMTFPLPSGVGVMPVNGLCAHPTLALFLVACSDNTLRYFSMNASQPLCIISSNNPRPTGSFDPQGWLFACTTERTVISICDCSSSQYDNGCVGQGGVKKIVSEGATMAVDVSQCIPAPTEFVCTLVFSPDSSNLVVGTNRHKLFCVDTIYPGKLVCFYQFENVTATAAEHPIPLALPVFSPDAEFLLCGNQAEIL
eukprot:GHVQ01026249.1.p1 GENE.GHVQ01026249.1~~GHVQ01026249.1.p1  ORF type:complete len:339 (+),score=31.32 GHVQ01026249.1:553-1569(+)